MRHYSFTHSCRRHGNSLVLALAAAAVVACGDQSATGPDSSVEEPAAGLGLDESPLTHTEAASETVAAVTRLPRSFFVDPRVGSDANAGTKLKPFKTLAHGLGVAIVGDTFRLASGVYSKAVNGEKFSTATTQVSVPSGVTIIGTLAEDFTTRLQGSSGDTYGLDLKGNATLRNLVVSNFPSAIRAMTGTQSLKAVVLEQNVIGLDLRGTAKATLAGNSRVFLTAPIGVSGLVRGANLSQQAQLTVTGGAFSGAGQNCRTATQGIVLNDASRVTVNGGAVLQNIAGTALALGSHSSATVVGSVIERDFSLVTGCTPLASVITRDSAVFTFTRSRLENAGGSASVGIQVESQGLLTLDSATVRGHTGAGIEALSLPKIVVKHGTLIGNNNIGIDVTSGEGSPSALTSSLTVLGATVIENDVGIRAPFLKLRGSKVSFNGSGIVLTGGDVPSNLGRAGAPGNNTFKGNGISGVVFELPVLGDEATVDAVGNTWNPFIQGSDADGHYRSQTVRGPEQGTNFQLENGNQITL